LFVEQQIYDEFVDGLASSAAEMKQGPGLDPESRMDPLVSEEQFNRVLAYLDIGKNEGAQVKTGGERNQALGKGYFVKPTVFTDVTNTMRIAQEEIFGPVVCAIPFKDENDVIRQANETIYGLSAGVWTRDVSKAHRMARSLRAGTVWVNCYNQLDPISSFGGYKQSGFGRELGIHSLDLYTQIKSVWLRIGAGFMPSSMPNRLFEIERGHKARDYMLRTEFTASRATATNRSTSASVTISGGAKNRASPGAG
jgi:acyl-CoA reductase-like NAD-dependent aldehyde dehydrogenase